MQAMQGMFFVFPVHQHVHADSLDSAKAYPAMMASRKNPALSSTKQILRHHLWCKRKREACIVRKSYATISQFTLLNSSRQYRRTECRT